MPSLVFKSDATLDHRALACQATLMSVRTSPLSNLLRYYDINAVRIKENIENTDDIARALLICPIGGPRLRPADAPKQARHHEAELIKDL
jgi:hypothetical protein